MLHNCQRRRSMIKRNSHENAAVILMHRPTKVTVFLAIVSIASIVISSKTVNGQASDRPDVGFRAVSAERGGQDAEGPYEAVADWPKPLSQLPGHEGWTWGTINGIYAESPNRV